VTRLAEQIKASHTLLDAFGAAKTATTASATRQGRLFELHYSREDSITSILSGAKVLTWGFDRSRLCAPLGKEERSFHIFYQFLAGASAQERESYHLLEDPSEYDLLASSGTYRLPAGATDDGTAFNELREAFSTLGFKPKHVELIYKLLSTILLLGNVTFAATADQTDSLAVSPESRPAFEHVAEMLGLPMNELERALVNKTTYIRKEVVCALLTEEGAHKQRDSLMCSLYAILFSYIVESANHRLFPGDEAVKKLQRDNGGTSIVLLDLPGFQMKSPSGGMTGDLAGNRGSSVGSIRRSTLIQAYGEDGYEQFGINYSNELLQHWLNRRAFNDDSHDLLKRAVADGVKLPEVDSLDTSSMTLELLRGGGIGSRADSKPGGLLGGLNKTCSNLRKGKVTTHEAADASFVEGLEERFSNHSRFIPRVSGGVASTFAIKHYAGTVSYSSKSFVEKDSDMFDSDFVRLFRTASSEVFLAKLFSGPSLAAESHPRDPAVIVAAQVSSQPLRRLSPLKVSRTSSTSVPSEAPEPEIAPVTAQLNETLTEALASLNEVPVWSVSCIRPNDNALPGVFDIRRARNQLDALDVRSLIARMRIDYTESYDFSEFVKRYKSIGASASADGEADAESVAAFLQDSKGLARGTGFAVGSSAVWLSFSAWKSLEGEVRAIEARDLSSKKAAAQPKKGPSALDVDAEKPGFPGLQATNSMDTLAVMGGAGEDGKGAFYGESQDDLLKNAGAAGEGGLYGGQTPTLPYDNDMGMGRPAPNYMRQSHMSFAPSFAGQMGGGAASDVWGPEWNGANGGSSQPVSPLPTKEGNGLPPGAAGAVNEKGGKKGTTVEELPTSFARRAWLILVWGFTWWIPTFTLTYLGRMKRPDVRLAWREKVTLCMLIALTCGSLVSLPHASKRVIATDGYLVAALHDSRLDPGHLP
jgi:chitin synthase